MPRSAPALAIVVFATAIAGAQPPQAPPPRPGDPLARGKRFAEQGRVDLFVAATAAWDLKADDPRLWEPAVDLGRRLIDRADMKGERRLQECPSSFADLGAYVKRCDPRFIRMDVTYFRPDPQKESPPVLYRNEGIQAAGVVAPTGFICSVIVSRGNIQTEAGVLSSVIFATGDLTVGGGMQSAVIVCDGNVTLTNRFIMKSVVVARGDITTKLGANSSLLAAGGKVTLGAKRYTKGEWYNEIHESTTDVLGITFFELSEVGVEAKAADTGVAVTAVAAGKAFAAAGVKVGDVVTAVNGKRPDSPESLRRLLRDALAVADAAVTLRRGDDTLTVKVALPE